MRQTAGRGCPALVAGVDAGFPDQPSASRSLMDSESTDSVNLRWRILCSHCLRFGRGALACESLNFGTGDEPPLTDSWISNATGQN